MLDALKEWSWQYSHDKKFLSGEKCHTYSRLKNDQPDLVIQITQHRKNDFSLAFKIPKTLKEHEALCTLFSEFWTQDYDHSKKSLDRWTYFASDRISFSQLCNQISRVQEQLRIQGDPLRNMLSDLVFNHLEAMDLIDVDYDGPVVYLDKIEPIFSRSFSALKVNFSFKNLGELLSPRGIQVQHYSPLKHKSSSGEFSIDDQMMDANMAMPAFAAHRQRAQGFQSQEELKQQLNELEGDLNCTRCSIQ